MEWDEELSGVADKTVARLVVPAGGSIRVHLGCGLNMGNDDRHITSIFLRRGFHYKRRKHALELKGPLTARDLLSALGKAVLYECARNQVLSSWLHRHLDENAGNVEDEDGAEATPVDSLPLKPEWAKLFEGPEVVLRPGDKPIHISPSSAAETRVLDAPADLDPTAGKSLDEVLDILGGKERAIDYIVGGGATQLISLRTLPAATGEGGNGLQEYMMKWSRPFA